MATVKTVAVTAAVATSLAYALNVSTGLSSDITTIRSENLAALNLKYHIARLGTHASLYHLLELADPQAEALWFEGRSWSYAALKEAVDYLSLGLREFGVGDGDFVAVFMSNSPEMVFTIYALSRLGAIPALINAALRGAALQHCISLSAAQLIITTPELSLHAGKVSEILSTSVRMLPLDLCSFPGFSAPESGNIIKLTPIHNSAPLVSPPRTLSSPSTLIYTSGTTGKPKACSVKSALIAAVSCPSAADTQNSNQHLPARTYSCMPLFHATTLFTGVCYSVGTSSCFCLSRKFSTRTFWSEVSASRATRILYVGELCRFLLVAPEGKWDRNHNVKVAIGNGLQRDVWIAFKRRFGVPEIREFYRSTEGLVKYDNRHHGQSTHGAGKVAFQGLLKRRLEKHQFLVKFDYANEQPYRHPKTGFCVLADKNEPGEAIARIMDMKTYTDYHQNSAATEAKIIRNVFKKGDVFQKSGDLLVHESSGWVRFVDRIGDTFRWKGENVSAGEVRAFISELEEVEDAVVVGRRLEGYDGQAGVAAISLAEAFKDKEKEFMETLYTQLTKKGIPRYGLPRLVALTGDIKVGDTFKHAKQFLKDLEWKPLGQVPSNKYWLDGDNYVQLTTGSWDKIERGLAKL